ncbi:MAG: hypothetical protein N2234_02050 [Planctomycetota bacterium]|nr:hypothetical protein [Planctomycetota bacterium]
MRVMVWRYFVVLLFTVFLMILLVKKEGDLTRAGYTIARLEQDIQELGEKVRRWNLLYQRLISAAILRSKVKTLQIPLVPAVPFPEAKDGSD